MRLRGVLAAALGALLTAACAPDPVRADGPDVFVFVLDDIGDTDLDGIPTPALDALAARGMRFRRAYSMPMCSQTRHALFFAEYRTQRHAFDCGATDPPPPPADQLALPRTLRDAGYETALFGKWNAGSSLEGPWEETPHLFGFERWYAGLFSNIKACGGQDFTNWLRVEDGASSFSHQHVLAAIEEAFTAWVRSPRDGPRFGYVGFQTAHAPWSMPPAALLPSGYRSPPDPSARDLYEANVIALDAALGRMLALLPADACIFVLGDNGTPPKARRREQESARLKGSVFEDGIRVPFIVTGPGVDVGVETTALVHAVDLFPTIVEVLGLRVPGLAATDGVSFHGTLADPSSGQRRSLYAGVDPGNLTPLREETLIEARWKLRLVDGVFAEFFDLRNDPTESKPLGVGRVPEEVTSRLRSELARARP